MHDRTYLPQEEHLVAEDSSVSKAASSTGIGDEHTVLLRGYNADPQELSLQYMIINYISAIDCKKKKKTRERRVQIGFYYSPLIT
jgi:hypothetical protein